MIDPAFLAPDVVGDTLLGKQPVGLTTEWLKTHALQSEWAEQRAIVGKL